MSERGDVGGRSSGDSHSGRRPATGAVGNTDGCSDSCDNCGDERNSAPTSALSLARLFDQRIWIRLR
jgi:hypothetical protein